jgi:hypothetical protein
MSEDGSDAMLEVKGRKGYIKKIMDNDYINIKWTIGLPNNSLI